MSIKLYLQGKLPQSLDVISGCRFPMDVSDLIKMNLIKVCKSYQPGGRELGDCLEQILQEEKEEECSIVGMYCHLDIFRLDPPPHRMH